MKLLRDLAQFPRGPRGSAVAIGNFDGVHRGHALIVERLLCESRRIGGPAVVFTFDPHPVRLLRPSAAPPPLTWTDRKAELLSHLGVDFVVAYPTDEALLSLTAREFFDNIVRDRLQARALVEGPNFYFGRDRSGNVELLSQLCAAAAMKLEVVEPLTLDDQIVSSSRVRQLVAAGDVGQARRLLTEPYRLRGMVVHGAARGAKIGFPTANVDAIDTLLPAAGVYAAHAYAAQQSWPAAVNIGPNPTFGEHAQKVEVHLIDAQVSLYGEPIEVEFLEKIRDVRRFDSVEALKSQLHEDVQAARVLSRLPEPN